MSITDILNNLFNNILGDVFQDDVTAFTVCVIAYVILTILEYVLSLVSKQFSGQLSYLDQ